jgi:heme-degrading monooxygenase HmoA
MLHIKKPNGGTLEWEVEWMSQSLFWIAQYNVARARADVDDAIMAEFARALKPINELADETPGFVWRLKTDKGDSTDIRPYEDRLMLITLSVWQSLEDLARFVYHSDHTRLLRRRREWFLEPTEYSLVLWWVAQGHIPDVAEAQERLEYVARHGCTPRAFTFSQTFAPLESLGP